MVEVRFEILPVVVALKFSEVVRALPEPPASAFPVLSAFQLLTSPEHHNLITTTLNTPL